jgi:serine/threonine protein kinase
MVQLTKAQMNEVILKGMLKDRGIAKPITPPKTPITGICAQPKLTEEERKQLSKKEKKKARKKKYLQRKKAQQKLLIEEEKQPNSGLSTQASLTNKKKRKRKANNKKAEKAALEESNQVMNEMILETEADEIIKPDIRRVDPVDETIKVKIADLGNACWVHNHFSTEIQTRQYRGPEVLIGVNYNHTADIWSFACMLFELVTGDFLFEPRGGNGFDKEDDHLAQMMETLGLIPKNFALSGERSKHFFNKRGELRRIKELKYWPLESVLVEKYKFKELEGRALADFLKPMLIYEPEHRATAKECLAHSWLSMPSNYDTHLSEEEYFELCQKQAEKASELNERILRGESLSSPDIPRELSLNADIEDNSASEEESFSSPERSAKEIEENTEYHEKMLRFREYLLG